MQRSTRLLPSLLLSLAALCGAAGAQEAVIRKALPERLPQLPKIDEVSRTPIPGLWEVRYGGTEILYSDDKGEHIFVNGSLVETKTRTDLTEARIEKMLAVSWDKLPMKDAVSIRQGTGARKLAVFADPNCGYCKRFERDLQKVNDVTIHTFLLPILSADSVEKSKNIWCAKDKNKAWLDWMVRDQPAAKASCDTSALERNLAFSKKYKITGTPTLFFADGSRVPGAIGAEQIEKTLASAKPR